MPFYLLAQPSTGHRDPRALVQPLYPALTHSATPTVHPSAPTRGRPQAENYARPSWYRNRYRLRYRSLTTSYEFAAAAEDVRRAP